MTFEQLDFSSPKSLYLQVTEIIERKITNNEVAIGQKLPPEEDLCRTFKVSIDTVRDALGILVKNGYLSRRPRRGTFVISSSPKKQKEIGVVVMPREDYVETFEQVEIFQEFLYPYIVGIEEKIKGNDIYGMRGLICKETEAALEAKVKDMAGLICMGMTAGTLSMVRKTGLPFVVINDVISDALYPEIDVVTDDPFHGVYIATKHLVELGHKSIALMFSERDKYEWTVQNLEGYRKALEEGNIEYNDNLVIDLKDTDIFTAYFGVKDFLGKGMPFTGFVGIAPQACTGAIRAMMEKNIKIPANVSITCADFSTRLTCASFDRVEIGRIAFNRLLERIENPSIAPARILVPAKLIVKSSSRKISE